MTTYTVVAGDTMWRISTKHGIGLSELLKANPQIKNSFLIVPGQTINIPSSSSTSTSTYTVVTGDTLWGIAAKQGISLSDLMTANPQITNSSLIFPGQKLTLPITTGTPSVPSTPSTPSTPSNPSTPSGSTDITSLENEVVRLVNVERAKAGVPAITQNSEVGRVARIKSEDFVKNNYFSHTSPTYGSPFDMLKSFGITFTAAGENIASGQKTAADVMNSWMNSSGHKANILNSTYNKIGVGVAKDSSGSIYWTQMFIRS
jgi:uncharacterized YkwD family protein/spore coat assembly protein SafA